MKLKKNEKLVNEFGDTIELDLLNPEKPYRVTFIETHEIKWFSTQGYAEAAVAGHHNAASRGIKLEWTKVTKY